MVANEPLWEITPTLPPATSRSKTLLKQATTPSSTLAVPMQFGPQTRTPAARAARTREVSRAAPSGPVSRNPELATIAAPIPLRPHSAITSGTRSADTAMNARSISPAGSSLVSFTQGAPSTSRYFGLTAKIGPEKPRCRSNANARPAYFIGSGETPTKATARGLNKACRSSAIGVSAAGHQWWSQTHSPP